MKKLNKSSKIFLEVVLAIAIFFVIFISIVFINWDLNPCRCDISEKPISYETDEIEINRSFTEFFKDEYQTDLDIKYWIISKGKTMKDYFEYRGVVVDYFKLSDGKIAVCSCVK